MLEGRPSNPKDFNHVDWRKKRLDDTARLADMLTTRGQDMTWWENVKIGRQDAWVKMCSPEFDPNKQVSREQYGR